MNRKSAPTIEMFPHHEPRKVMLMPLYASRAYKATIGPWKRQDRQWHSWKRDIAFSYRGFGGMACLIWVNGHGRDHEVRWDVWDHRTSHWQPKWSSEGVLPADFAHPRLWSGRGIQYATIEDILWLAKWCDERVAEIYCSEGTK